MRRGFAPFALLLLAGCTSSTSTTTASTPTSAPSAAATIAAAKTTTSGAMTTGAAPTGEPIKIGEYASLTGTTATFGQSTDHGIQIAVDEINKAGGILGRPVKVIVEDTQSKPETSKTAVLKLINQDHVVALLGEIASSRTLAAAPDAQRAKIPMITPGSTNPTVTEKGDYIFRICFIDPFQGLVMARFAAQELHAKRAAILTDIKNDYSVGLAKFFKEEFTRLGGTIVKEASYSEGDADFKAQLTSIKDAKPDILVVPGYYTEVGMVANQRKDLGMDVPMLGGDGWDSNKTLEIGGKAIEGSYFTNHYAADDPNPIVQDFIKKYKSLYHETPDAMAALGYDSMRVLGDAIKRAGSDNPTKIRDAIAATKDYPAVTGNVTIDEKRNAKKAITVIQIKDGNFHLAKAIQP
jgi:branched-chain amino acid transport system substrate-binding protein